MKKSIKRVLAAVLAATMVIGMMAVSAFAADTDGYHVAGNAGLCGEGHEWDTSANLMTDNGDGTYSITFTGIAAGNYEFKVELNNWENDWNFDGSATGGVGNAWVEVEEDNSTVVITFDGEKVLPVQINPKDDAPADDKPTGDSAATAAVILAAVAALAAVATVSVKKYAVER